MTPQKAEGWRIDPPVSEPKARGASPAATAAQEPPEEPPGTLVRSQGFFVSPKAEVSVVLPMANSSILVLPSMIIPASSSFSTAPALYGGTKSFKILEAQVVACPRVQILSFTAMGTPARGPVYFPWRMPFSTSFTLAYIFFSSISR